MDLFDAKTHRRATVTTTRRVDPFVVVDDVARDVVRWRWDDVRRARARGYVARVRGRALTRGEDGRAIGAGRSPSCARRCAGAGASFSVEVCVRDAGETRRRLVFSSSFTDVRATPLHCQVPLRNAEGRVGEFIAPVGSSRASVFGRSAAINRSIPSSFEGSVSCVRFSHCEGTRRRRRGAGRTVMEVRNKPS